MILVLTSSFDETTDYLLPRLSQAGVFRFNIDLWREYTWTICPDSYHISDPIRRACNETEVGAVYLRKLFFNPPYIDVPAGGSEEAWRRHELMEVWEGIRDLAHASGKLALVHPSPAGRWNKMRQMRLAARYFRVPQWRVFHADHGQNLPSQVVAKSFGQLPVGNGAHMLVNRVAPDDLSPDFPWFLQEAVDGSTHDVTVVYVKGRLFAFRASRIGMQGVDCRQPSTSGNLQWERCVLSADEADAVRGFVGETGFSFARLDFLSDEGGLWFLEINPNGQFAWLDIDGKEGLLDAVCDEILAVHSRNQPEAEINL